MRKVWGFFVTSVLKDTTALGINLVFLLKFQLSLLLQTLNSFIGVKRSKS